MHARLQLMNANLFAVDINLGATRHIGNMSNASIFHFDYQVVAFHQHNLPALHVDFLCVIPGRGCLLRLYLGDGRTAESEVNHYNRKYEFGFHPIASQRHFLSSVMELMEDFAGIIFFSHPKGSLSVSAYPLLCQRVWLPRSRKVARIRDRSVDDVAHGRTPNKIEGVARHKCESRL